MQRLRVFWYNISTPRSLIEFSGKIPLESRLTTQNRFISRERDHNSRLQITKKTTCFFSVSRFNTLRIISKRYVEVYSDPTLVPNGCWDQKLDHFLGLINSKITKPTLTLQLIKSFKTSFYRFYYFNGFRITSQRYAYVYSDPTLVSNGCWVQKLDHFHGLINLLMTKLTRSITTCTICFYSFSCVHSLHNASQQYIEVYSDPTLVPNGCWDQKLDHFLGLINSKITKPIISLQLIKLTTHF